MFNKLWQGDYYLTKLPKSLYHFLMMMRTFCIFRIIKINIKTQFNFAPITKMNSNLLNNYTPFCNAIVHLAEMFEDTKKINFSKAVSFIVKLIIMFLFVISTLCCQYMTPVNLGSFEILTLLI